jgi:hypothetical protein
MSILTIETDVARIVTVKVSDAAITIDLADGRTVSVPLSWYPRLLNASAKERSRWRLIGEGAGIHWLEIDEDISVENILAGKPSGESQRSFKKWMERRKGLKKLKRAS